MKSLKLMIASLIIGVAALIVPATVLASDCPSRLGTNQLGDGRMYSCYLTGEDENYCYYDCYAIS
jgi:hypothetical protein